MSMILRIDAGSEFVLARASGKFSLQGAKRTFLETLEAVARNRVAKVLFDGREVSGEPTTIERFCYGEFVAGAVSAFRDLGVSGGTRFAYVLNPPVLDPARFGETVAINRGMKVKATDGLEDAVRWLRIEPADKPAAGDGAGMHR